MINECQAAASSEEAANFECLAEEEGFELSRYDSRDLLAHVGSLHSPHCNKAFINTRINRAFGIYQLALFL